MVVDTRITVGCAERWSRPTRVRARRAAPQHSARSPGALAVLALASLAACAGARVELAVEPGDAQLWVDGRRAQPGSHPLPYYGTVDVAAAAPLARLDERPPRRHAQRTALELHEPFSPWLFPLDFVLEVATGAGGEVHGTRLALPERTDALVPGIAPPHTEELRERSRRSALER